MDAMLGAIKARKSKDAGLMDAPQEAAPMQQAPAEGQNVLQALVMQLSPVQKQELMQLLSQTQKVDAKAIEKGEPTPTEQAAVAAEAGEGESDEPSEIAASMVDKHAERMAEGNAKPRNLGERARMNTAKKLKSKGK